MYSSCPKNELQRLFTFFVNCYSDTLEKGYNGYQYETSYGSQRRDKTVETFA